MSGLSQARAAVGRTARAFPGSETIITGRSLKVNPPETPLCVRVRGRAERRRSAVVSRAFPSASSADRPPFGSHGASWRSASPPSGFSDNSPSPATFSKKSPLSGKFPRAPHRKERARDDAGDEGGDGGLLHHDQGDDQRHRKERHGVGRRTLEGLRSKPHTSVLRSPSCRANSPPFT